MKHRQSRCTLWPVIALAGLAGTGLGFRWASTASPDLPNLWPILAGSLALLLPIGLALLASGGLPDQRAVTAAMLGVLALGVGSIGYLLTGFAFEFGGVGLVSSLPGLDKSDLGVVVSRQGLGTGLGNARPARVRPERRCCSGAGLRPLLLPARPAGRGSSAAIAGPARRARAAVV